MYLKLQFSFEEIKIIFLNIYNLSNINTMKYLIHNPNLILMGELCYAFYYIII